MSCWQKSSPAAGKLTPEYHFWMAKARYLAGDFAKAAEGFAAVAKEAKDFPDFPRRLEAAYDEAEARSRMGDWAGVIRLLQEPNGAFRMAVADDPKIAMMGSLLLGEALLQQGHYGQGEALIGALDASGMAPDLRWQQLYLLCRLQLAAGKAQTALDNSTNLIELAFGPRFGPSHQAASVFLQARILEQLARPDDALPVYAKLLVDSQPPEVQREALLARTVDLTLTRDTPADAIQALETFIQQQPQARALDLARVSLGELYLKVYASPPHPAAGTNAPAAALANTNSITNHYAAPSNTPATNTLGAALTNFTIVIRDFTNSTLLPKAHLDRGWCLWLAGDIAAARSDFEAAAGRLPLLRDEAVARFKLADAQFRLHDYDGAAANYALVLTNKTPEITNALFDLALYQLAQADIQRGDTNGARQTVDKILTWYPVSLFGGRGQLLMGEDLNRKYDYANARAVFTNFLQRSPDSPLVAQVLYRIAQTYDLEGNRNEAISRYQQWVIRYAGDAFRPEVDFHLALARANAGLTNNALAGFTNFLARYPSNDLAPWALNSVADYYYNQGDFISAEKNYEELFQKYPFEKYPSAGDLSYQAQFWAGKSALARPVPGIEDATNYFLKLINDTNAPPALVAQGYFAMGDIFFLQFLANPANPTNLVQALNYISKLTNGAPTNAIAVEALGRLGDYYLQWAVKSTNGDAYTYVKPIYDAILAFPPAAVSAADRCQAEVGLGVVAEQERHPQLALEHYYNVVYKFDPAHFDPYWVQVAGVSAARICEEQQHWKEALNLYERLRNLVPALRPVLEKKMAAAQAHCDPAAK